VNLYIMKLLFYILIVVLTSNVHAQSYAKDIDFNKLSLQFEHASSELKPEYYPLIYRLADTLSKNPNLHVLVRGHVCCVNKNGLAKKRAKVVRNFLVFFGVDKHQITTQGMKNTIPVVFPEKTREDELANMRVDFVLTNKK
ncbi:MAG: OmpA family protein, partial [Crocinitomicaceae bacterium]|nr:OmpA family protein [Crocinitomicaceae bacterium]